MPEDTAVPDSIHERVGKTEQSIHTLEHRVQQLEGLPPRVSTLERDFSVMTEILGHIKDDNAQIKKDVATMKTGMDRMYGAVESIPRYIKITGFIVFIAGLAAVSAVLFQ